MMIPIINLHLLTDAELTKLLNEAQAQARRTERALTLISTNRQMSNLLHTNVLLSQQLARLKQKGYIP